MDDATTSERFRSLAVLAGLSSGFEALFRAAPSPFLVVTPPDYSIIAVNDAYLRATMTERAAILGRELFDVFPENPDNPTVEGPPELRESLRRVVVGRRLDEMPVVRYDIPRPAAHGGGFEERWWRPRNAPILGPSGDVVCIIHHVEDVTARVRAETALVESERRLRATQNSVGVGIHEVDEAGKYLRMNETFTRLTGFTIADFAGRSMFDGIRDDGDRRVAHERYQQLIRGEIESYLEEWSDVTKEGRQVWVEILTTAVRDDERRFLYAVRAIHDVTQRRNAEVSLRESEQQLRAAVSERDALLKELHHRVKNNLQVITSLLEMQGRQASDRQAFASLSEARDRITAIASIHEQLYQSGSLSEVDLTTYARRLVRYVSSLYDQESRIDASVTGDALMIDLARAVPLGLLLNELISNAYKHAFRSRAGGELRVALHNDNGHLRLNVRDTGVGISGVVDDEQPATLGLRLVRMLAKQLGGTVTFDAAAGTSVEVRVPMQWSA